MQRPGSTQQADSPTLTVTTRASTPERKPLAPGMSLIVRLDVDGDGWLAGWEWRRRVRVVRSRCQLQSHAVRAPCVNSIGRPSALSVSTSDDVMFREGRETYQVRSVRLSLSSRLRFTSVADFGLMSVSVITLVAGVAGASLFGLLWGSPEIFTSARLNVITIWSALIGGLILAEGLMLRYWRALVSC